MNNFSSNVASLSMAEEASERKRKGTNQLPPQMYPNPMGRNQKNNGAGLLPTPQTIPINLIGNKQSSGNYYNDFDDVKTDDNQKSVSEGKIIQSRTIVYGSPVDYTNPDIG